MEIYRRMKQALSSPGWNTHIQGSDGMSLIEIMVSLLVVSIVSMSLISLVRHTTQSVSYLEDKIATTNLEKVIQLEMLDSEACTQSFAGIALSAINAIGPTVNIKNNLGVVLHEVGAISSDNKAINPTNTNMFERLVITSLSLDNVSVAGASSFGTAYITVGLQRTRTGGGPSKFRPIRVPISVTTDAANSIVTCGKEGGAGNILLAIMSPPGTLLSNPPANAESNLIADGSVDVPSGATKLIFNVQLQAGCPTLMSNAAVTVKVNGASVYLSSITLQTGSSSNEAYRYIQDVTPGAYAIQVFIGNDWPVGCTWVCSQYSVIVSYM